MVLLQCFWCKLKKCLKQSCLALAYDWALSFLITALTWTRLVFVFIVSKPNIVIIITDVSYNYRHTTNVKILGMTILRFNPIRQAFQFMLQELTPASASQPVFSNGTLPKNHSTKYGALHYLIALILYGLLCCINQNESPWPVGWLTLKRMLNCHSFGHYGIRRAEI